jgi:hypothetical protein
MRNDDLLRNFVVERDHVIIPGAVMKNSHDGSVRPIYRPQYPALGLSVVADFGDFDQDLVAVHR